MGFLKITFSSRGNVTLSVCGNLNFSVTTTQYSLEIRALNTFKTTSIYLSTLEKNYFLNDPDVIMKEGLGK